MFACFGFFLKPRNRRQCHRVKKVTKSEQEGHQHLLDDQDSCKQTSIGTATANPLLLSDLDLDEKLDDLTETEQKIFDLEFGVTASHNDGLNQAELNEFLKGSKMSHTNINDTHTKQQVLARATFKKDPFDAHNFGLSIVTNTPRIGNTVFVHSFNKAEKIVFQQLLKQYHPDDRPWLHNQWLFKVPQFAPNFEEFVMYFYYRYQARIEQQLQESGLMVTIDEIPTCDQQIDLELLDDEDPISFEDFEEGEDVVSLCGQPMHAFHAELLEGLNTEQQHDCPICRKPPLSAKRWTVQRSNHVRCTKM